MPGDFEMEWTPGSIKKKGSSHQIRLMTERVAELQARAVKAQLEHDKLSGQVQALEEMIHRGGLWLSALPEVKLLAARTENSSCSSYKSAQSSDHREPNVIRSPEATQSLVSDAPVDGDLSKLLNLLESTSDHVSKVLKDCTPAYAARYRDWDWKRWNKRLEDFCQAASFLLVRLESPLGDLSTKAEIEALVEVMLLDVSCLVMHYPQVMIQCTSRNCLSGQPEAAPLQLWEHVTHKLKLDTKTVNTLAAGYECYSKVQGSIAAERTPLLEQLQQLSSQDNPLDDGSAVLLTDVLDAIEHTTKRSQQAGLGLALLLWSFLSPCQLAVLLVSSFPFWLAAVPVCKSLHEQLQAATARELEEEQQQQQQQEEKTSSGIRAEGKRQRPT